MMTSLTLDLDTSASILGTDPELFLKFLTTKNIPGVLFFTEKPKISIFTLAQLLNTKPEILLDWLSGHAKLITQSMRGKTRMSYRVEQSGIETSQTLAED